MLTDELFLLARSQPEVRETRPVKVLGPTLQEAVRAGRVRSLADIRAHPDQTIEVRTFRYGHVLGAGLVEADILDWQNRFPEHSLPADLVAFLFRVNDVHFWADLDSERAYFGIAPLAEWKDAASPDARHLFERPPQSKLVVSYHQNGDVHVVLDTASSAYTWIDHEDLFHPQLIGTTVAALLDWLWVQAGHLRRTTSGAG